MTLLTSSDYDPQFFSEMLRRLAVQVNSDAGTSLLVSHHYDKQFIPAMLRRLVDAINDHYSGDIISSYHYDDQFIAQTLKRCVDKVNAGASETPDWVPANAKIYIDLIAPGRAWTEDDGEVAIDTLLGTDANTSNGWNDSAYDAGNLTVNGYLIEGGTPPALIGGALSAILSGATVVIRTRNNGGNSRATNFVVMAADGNDAIEMDLADFAGGGNIIIASYSGPLSVTGGVACANYLVTNDAINVVAATITNTRAEVAANGVDIQSGSIGSTDRPAGNPFVAALIDSPHNALQSITIYDALPSTAGLSALSET